MCGSASSLTGFAPGWAMNGEPKAKKARSNDCWASCRPFGLGTLKIAGQDLKRLLTQIPPELNTLLGRLGLSSFVRPTAGLGFRCSPKTSDCASSSEETFSKPKGS